MSLATLLRMRRYLICGALAGAALVFTLATGPQALAAAPIRIGVLAPAAHIDGKAIFNAAKLAASEMNAAGGIDGRQVKIFTYDDKFSASDAARAFQRAVTQDHVVAMVGIFTSEVALAMEPWAARLKTPLIITGAATPKLEENVHANYNRYKYVFHGFTNSIVLAREACLATRDTVVDQLGYKKAVIFSENADWTKAVDAEYKKCIPQMGMKLVKTINFSPSTNDFTPLYNEIESSGAHIIMAAIAHVGVKPVVQWHQQQVPALFAGLNGQAGASEFWNATNGATEGVIDDSNEGANGVPLTPRSPEFYKAYKKKFHLSEPAYDAYTTYDAMYTLKHAIEDTHSTKADELIKGIENVNFTGVTGRIHYYGRDNKWTHEVVHSPNPELGQSFVALQWQHGKQVVIWPKKVSEGSVVVPSFVTRK
ncbi:MAG TPA: ABC transporter substrate-binding protein [Gammaproteobacteria bacterium]|nr:ABC transporter substrate-binding protein [Gammaproteobacteria bacterium]